MVRRTTGATHLVAVGVVAVSPRLAVFERSTHRCVGSTQVAVGTVGALRSVTDAPPVTIRQVPHVIVGIGPLRINPACATARRLDQGLAQWAALYFDGRRRRELRPGATKMRVLLRRGDRRSTDCTSPERSHMTHWYLVGVGPEDSTSSSTSHVPTGYARATSLPNRNINSDRSSIFSPSKTQHNYESYEEQEHSTWADYSLWTKPKC